MRRRTNEKSKYCCYTTGVLGTNEMPTTTPNNEQMFATNYAGNVRHQRDADDDTKSLANICYHSHGTMTSAKISRTKGDGNE